MPHKKAEVEVARDTKYLLDRRSEYDDDESEQQTYCDAELDKTTTYVLADVDHLAVVMMHGAELGLEAVDLRLKRCYRVGHGSRR
jgi:hypothetical protein